jgi:hypothetical protein
MKSRQLFCPRLSDDRTTRVTIAFMLSIAATLVCSSAANDHGIRLFLYQQDEVDTLSDWLTYHAKVLGTSSITIIDHMSTQPAVTNVLKHWIGHGVNVVQYSGPFSLKHSILTSTMHNRLVADSNAKYLVPIDADEFIVLLTANGSFTVDAPSIQQYFSRLPQDGVRYKFTPVVAGFCGPRNHTGRRAIDVRHFTVHEPICSSKTFYWRDGFISTDQGNHWGSTMQDVDCFKEGPIYPNTNFVRGPPCPREAHCFHRTQLGLIHYGGRTALSYAALQIKMLRGYHAYHGNMTNPDCSIPGGRHYCNYFLRWQQGGEVAAGDALPTLPGCGPHTYHATIAETVQPRG